MASDLPPEFKYADYDDGQPESEKRGVHLRSRTGDNTVTYLVVGAIAVLAVAAALWAIPGVQGWMDRINSPARAAFSADFVECDSDTFRGSADLTALDDYESLAGATAFDVIVSFQNRAKDEVDSGTERIFLVDRDLGTPVSVVVIGSNPTGAAPITQCQLSVEVIRP